MLADRIDLSVVANAALACGLSSCVSCPLKVTNLLYVCVCVCVRQIRQLPERLCSTNSLNSRQPIDGQGNRFQQPLHSKHKKHLQPDRGALASCVTFRRSGSPGCYLSLSLGHMHLLADCSGYSLPTNTRVVCLDNSVLTELSSRQTECADLPTRKLLPLGAVTTWLREQK